MNRTLQLTSRISRRFLADQAPATPSRSKLLLNLVTPHQAIYQNQEVERVDLPASTGDMGVLANHVPTIQQLKPGMVDVVIDATKSKKLFVSGGFAVVSPDNVLNINVLEAATIDEIDKSAVKSQLAEAQRKFDKASNEDDKALASAELELFQALEKYV
ncbi:hypothetical protein MP228_004677 [Amoeboaphelidium protococcarum]|nr:hypothetical protein MP228_004677 [Amoeboaphelidium protococcarum]